MLTYSTFTLVHMGLNWPLRLVKCSVYLKGFSFLLFIYLFIFYANMEMKLPWVSVWLCLAEATFLHFLLQKPKHFSVQPMWLMEENTMKIKSWPVPAMGRGNVMLRLAQFWRVARQLQQSFGSEINWVTKHKNRGSYRESYGTALSPKENALTVLTFVC